jgi:hypothetical protein
MGHLDIAIDFLGRKPRLTKMNDERADVVADADEAIRTERVVDLEPIGEMIRRFAIWVMEFFLEKTRSWT